MNLNPLRTLAGRLILVTIAAITLSYAAVFALFANEREGTIRRQGEATVIERLVVTADRMADADPGALENIARTSSDFRHRFSFTDRPLDASVGGGASRIARTAGEALAGAETHARVRIVEIEWPGRRLEMWRERAAQNPAEGRPPREDRRIERRPLPPAAIEATPGSELARRVTEVTIDTALPNGRWLRLRAYLPAPRPLPMNVWYAALASILAVGAGAVLIARQIGKPLSDLANAAERLGQGETGVHAPVSGPDDVRRASAAFNAMSDRLGRQMNRQRQMLWALSHDLRTPITALRLRAELIEEDSARQRLLGPLAEMELMTEQALSLARAGASEEARVSVDLAEIARTLCGELDEIGIAARADASTPVFTECRPSEIARAMRNLAENAAKYGGGGLMRVYRDPKGDAVIDVSDDGPGVAPDILARINAPFFRADASRSGEGGAGLGLAIVQAIADGHGGRLELENRTPKGFRARLILPR